MINSIFNSRRLMYQVLSAVFSSVLLSLSLSSCSDEIKVTDKNNDGTPSLTLNIPNIASYRTKATFPVGDEGTMNTLVLYLFNEEGNLYKNIDLTNATPEENNETGFRYTLYGVAPGTYYAYLLSNIEKYWTAPQELTKDNLENAILNFNSDKQLVSGHLPMACLAENIVEKDGNGKITLTDENSVITAPMSFLCSKVRYTLLFNPEENGISTGFGDAEVEVLLEGDNSPYVTQLVSQTQIKYNDSNKGDFIKENDNNYSNWLYNLSKYNYPESGDNYPRKEEGSPEADLDENWTTGSKKVAWQGVIYLPENMHSETPTKIVVNAEIGGVTSQNVIKIQSSEEGVMQRGYMYDIVSKFQTPWAVETTISEYDWNEMLLPVDMVHTYLTLEKTQDIFVSSNRDAEIIYDTDGRGGIKLICSQKQGDKEIIVGETGFNEDGVKVLIIKINNDLDINDSELVLKTDEPISCYVCAGNIKKEIKISYDIEPKLEISSESITFNWADGAPITQSLSFETNLGGVNIYLSDESGNKIQDITDDLSNLKEYELNVPYVEVNGDVSVTKNEISRITLLCEKTNVPEGSIDVNSLKSKIDEQETTPSHIAKYYLLFETKKQYNNENLTALGMISIIPAQGPYRIYYRAINDFQINRIYNPGGNYQYAELLEYLNGDYSKFPNEETNKWTDWWDMHKLDVDQGNYTYNNENPGNEANSERHNLYIYGQNGETGAGFSNESWHFSDYNPLGYNGNSNRIIKMTGDETNRGWYFYDLDPATQAYRWVNNSRENVEEKVTPGRTLLIFNSMHNTYEGHRCSHHNDPGVPLFNYEDREGWYLYDPTREPYYTVLDEKPAIEDITYVIYTHQEVTGWEREYGIANDATQYDSNKKQFKMFGNVSSGSGLGKCEKVNNEWYKTQLKFKAPKGDYSKNIEIFSLPVRNRIYLETNSTNGTWMKKNPKAHISKDGYNTYKDWTSSDENMTQIGSTGIYYYDLPEGYENGLVIFHSDDGQYPLDGEGWIRMKPGHNIQDAGDLGIESSAWKPYNGIKPGQVSFGHLFGGQNYQPSGSTKTIYGYYDGRNWHSGRPSGVSY